MYRLTMIAVAAACLASCTNDPQDAADTSATWQSPDTAQLLAVYQAAGDDVAVIDQNGSDYGPMSIFVSGVELTSQSEIEALRESAVDVTSVSTGSADCTAIDGFPMEQFCMLSVSSFEIVPEGLECSESECGESYFEITARLRLIAPGEWQIVGDTAAGLFAG